MNKKPITMIALIVALGGFLMGFDASVISGVIKFIEPEFSLTKIELGWAVASLALTASFAMMVSGPLSDKLGRIPVLKLAAALFFISAIGSALATSFTTLIIARMIGGLGVGAALIIAPMYIAEISPPAKRGRMVSFNQLNIVIGLSAAFFTNYIILKLGQSNAEWVTLLRIEEWNWRWMLGLEALPALLYLMFLYLVPESPRWLLMHNKKEQALATMERFNSTEQALKEIQEITANIAAHQDKTPIKELFAKPLRLALTIGLTVAILQQIVGINAVFFYAPMIFEQSGIGTDASFMQAILVGLTNLAFTLLAMALIDRVGRKPLLVGGMFGITCFMLLLAYGFNSASYTLTPETISQLSSAISKDQLANIANITYDSDIAFKQALVETLGTDQLQRFESELINSAISMNPSLILFGILGFVASFAISIGPVMWVLFSELFPNRVRALAISFVGLVNSGVSFLVQLVFPWQLANFGNSTTFLIYGSFALLGLLLIIKILPETKGHSLEKIESLLAPQ